KPTWPTAGGSRTAGRVHRLTPACRSWRRPWPRWASTGIASRNITTPMNSKRWSDRSASSTGSTRRPPAWWDSGRTASTKWCGLGSKRRRSPSFPSLTGGRGIGMSLLLEIAISGLLLGGLYALIAIGLNLQYGLMRVLNVAHGEFLMVGGYITYLLVTLHGWNPLTTLLASGPLLFALGMLVHLLLFRHLVRLRRTRDELEANSLLLSFGLLFIVQNVALLLWHADIRGYRYLDQPMYLLGAAFPTNRIVAFATAVVLTLLLFAFLRWTLVGTALRALMQDVIGARLIGLPVPLI